MSNNYNLSVNDFGKICRTCLAEGEISNGEMKLLFEKCPKEVCLIEMLMSITFVQFSEKNDLPVQICLNCVSEVTRAYKFAQKCLEVDEKLRKCLQEFMDSRSKSALFPTDTFDISDKQTTDLEDEIQIKTEIECDEHEIEVKPEIVLIKKELLSDQEESYYNETNEKISKEKSDNIVNEGGSDSDFHPENDSEYSVYDSEEELKLEKRTANETKSKQPNLNRVNCKICSKSFSSANIYVHMKIHSEERPFFCEFCGLEFITTKQLVEHRRTHTGEKPYQLNKAPRTSAERGREFRARKALLRQQSKQQQQPNAIVEIATEDIQSAAPSADNQVLGPSQIRTLEKKAKSAEATRRWREKKRGVRERKQAKTAAERMREYRQRKKIIMSSSCLFINNT